MSEEKQKYTFTRYSSYAAPARMNQDGQLCPPEIHKKNDGYLLVRSDGSLRFLGLWESFCHRMGWAKPEDFK
jgi:hypothetical protein